MDQQADLKNLSDLSIDEVEYFFKTYYRVENIGFNGAVLLKILNGVYTFEDFEITFNMKEKTYNTMMEELQTYKQTKIPLSKITDKKTYIGTAGVTTDIESIMRRVILSMKPKEIFVRRWQLPGEFKPFSFTDVTTFDDFQFWCSATFSVSDPRIYFLLNKTDWESRERIVDTTAMLKVFSLSIEDKKRTSLIVISCEQSSPTKAPADFDSISDLSIGSVKVSSNLSRGEGQKIFRNQVLSRDKNICVFCRSTEYLEAAHIFNVKDGGNAEMMCKLDLNTLYDVDNGITLCHDCHQFFDWHLCSVHIEDNDNTKVSVIATDALLESSDEKVKSKWQNLHGKPLSFPDNLVQLTKRWPQASLFQYRESEFLSKNSERRKNNEGKVLCPECNLPFPLKSISKHAKSKSCINLASNHGKKKLQYTTPIKKDSTI